MHRILPFHTDSNRKALYLQLFHSTIKRYSQFKAGAILEYKLPLMPVVMTLSLPSEEVTMISPDKQTKGSTCLVLYFLLKEFFSLTNTTRVNFRYFFLSEKVVLA